MRRRKMKDLMRLEVSRYYETPLPDAGVEIDEPIVRSVEKEIRMALQETCSPSHRFKEEVRECGGFIIRITIYPHRFEQKGRSGGNGENP